MKLVSQNDYDSLNEGEYTVGVKVVILTWFEIKPPLKSLCFLYSCIAKVKENIHIARYQKLSL